MKGPFLTANTILYCRDWSRTVQFYRDQLGLPVLFSSQWFIEFAINDTARLSVADEKRSSIKSCGGQGITVTLEVRDIRSIWEKFDKAGLTPTPIKTHPWGALVFYIFDPEGHRIEVWQI
ncbi:MAG: VOC family protein [Synergistales bacterium]|nr:VOC family protein [Dethiosulfovibrio sp.]NCC96895.1 VOC family protein [Synergistales bacterium]